MHSCNLTRLRAEIPINQPLKILKNKWKRPAKEQPLVNLRFGWGIATACHCHHCRLSINSTQRQPNISDLSMGQDRSPWRVFQIHSPIIPPLITPIYHQQYHNFLPEWSRRNFPQESNSIFFFGAWLLCYLACHIDQYWHLSKLSSASTSSPLAANLARCSDAAAWAVAARSFCPPWGYP